MALATAQSGSLLLGVEFLGGLAAVTGLLAGASLWLTRHLVPRLAARLPRASSRVWLRHGVPAPGRASAAQS